MSDDFLSEEDKALFREMTKAVKPLKKGKKIAPIVKAIPPRPRTKSLAEHEPIVYLSDSYNEAVEADSILSYYCSGLPAKRFQELKKGRISYQTRFDLHGMRPQEAKLALVKLIEQQVHQGHRCLLIIHGKGGHRSQAPILKNLVNHWLRQIPQVLAFHSCLPKDGGSGAVYVLLKRQRGDLFEQELC